MAGYAPRTMNRCLVILCAAFLLIGCREEEPWQSDASVYLYGRDGSLRIDWLSNSLFRFTYFDEGAAAMQVEDTLWFLVGEDGYPDVSLKREGRNYVVESATLRLEVDRRSLHTTVLAPKPGQKPKVLAELLLEEEGASSGLFQSELGYFPDLTSLTRALSAWDKEDVGQEVAPYLGAFPDLRKELAPWLKSLARSEQQGAVAAVQPVYLHFLRDEEALSWRKQYFLGGQVLVAPEATTEGEDAEVYLPIGEWYDYHTGKRLEGGRRYRPAEGLLPLYVKSAGILPLAAEGEVLGVDDSKMLFFRVFPGLIGRFLWYESQECPTELLTSNTAEFFQLIVPAPLEGGVDCSLWIKVARGDAPREVLVTVDRSVTRLERLADFASFLEASSGWYLDRKGEQLQIKAERLAESDVRFLVSY